MTKPSLRTDHTKHRFRATAARQGRLLAQLRHPHRLLSAMEVSEQAFRAAGALALAEAVFGDRGKALAWLRTAGSP
ncbi:hypothetical protein [Nitrospirillum viridazoti]|uniref:Uncharacterized protein n=1 Tax=Nitrospirillum viridazoti CBAmc TaxID=1441467 RepID=A0A248JQC8_9PROT|nr:hypothetical protein [Nitrospirillum amazonense]ASG20905.1 hypothetical protein Y958_08820 [Nitrospirillum amazonense CBAmc]TWB37748.1 hypothetical protein FBZ91_10761 [Nitrospirillum amazonense]